MILSVRGGQKSAAICVVILLTIPCSCCIFNTYTRGDYDERTRRTGIGDCRDDEADSEGQRLACAIAVWHGQVHREPGPELPVLLMPRFRGAWRIRPAVQAP